MSLGPSLKNLFVSKEDADVTFVVQNKEILAHQMIVTHRSSVLKAMIKGSMAPANQRHEINDPQVRFEDFKNFIEFLYTDQCNITFYNLEALLYLGHMYNVSTLFEFCVNNIPSVISGGNLYRIAEIGLLYENKCDIVKKCLNEVPRVAADASLAYCTSTRGPPNWIKFELLMEFVKHCPRTAKFTEDVLFGKVFEWVIYHRGESRKAIIAPFVPYINFKKLDMKTLTSTVYENKLLSDEQLLKCIVEKLVEKQNNPDPETILAGFIKEQLSFN